MRVSLKPIGRWGLLLVSATALWSMGPGGMRGPKPVFAAKPAIVSGQINRLGQGLALETYYDVASSQLVSAGGYGGPGHSGGDGDALVRLINVGNFAVATNGTLGALCANFYVFDDDEELQACCSCFVGADGVRTLSVISNLIFNPAFNNARM